MPVTTFEDDSDCYQKRGKRRDVPGTLTTPFMSTSNSLYTTQVHPIPVIRPQIA